MRATFLPIAVPLALLVAACGQDKSAPAVPAVESVVAAEASTSEPAAKPAASPTKAAQPANTVSRPVVPGEIERCRGMCSKTRELDCGPTTKCLQLCMGMFLLDVCEAERSAVFDCTLAEPSPHWECRPDGVAALKQPYCRAPQQAFQGCMKAALGRPAPP